MTGAHQPMCGQRRTVRTVWLPGRDQRKHRRMTTGHYKRQARSVTVLGNSKEEETNSVSISSRNKEILQITCEEIAVLSPSSPCAQTSCPFACSHRHIFLLQERPEREDHVLPIPGPPAPCTCWAVHAFAERMSHGHSRE